MKYNEVGSDNPDAPPHADILAPGWDNLEFSYANICGAPGHDDVFESREASELFKNLPEGMTLEDKINRCDKIKNKRAATGCKYFTSWGWHQGGPQFLYQPVKCPKAFEDVIRNSIKEMKMYHLPGQGDDD